MSEFLGNYNISGKRTHVRFLFTTNNSAGGAVAPSSAFESSDVFIYRAVDNAGFTVKRNSSNGISVTSSFNGIVGLHSVDINLSDNTDPGFYSDGLFSVVLAPDETVDGQTVVSALKYFEIGPPPGVKVEINAY